MVAQPTTEQLTFDQILQAKSKPSARAPKRKAKAKAGLARGEFEPVAPPNLAQESSLWLTGQRSVEAQRGKRYVKAGIKHPGKMQPDVAGAAIDTYTQPGWHIVDCMGGQGTTGVEGAERGRHVTVIELVKHWANVAYANAVRTAYRGSPGSMQVICGDARRLPQLLAGLMDAAIMSPPYGEALEKRTGRAEGRVERIQRLIAEGVLDPSSHNTFAGKVASQGMRITGQGGAMACMNPEYAPERHQVDAAFFSPPYGEAMNQDPAASDDEARRRRLEAAGHDEYKFGPNSVQAQPQQYDAVVSSPVYGDSRLRPIPSDSIYVPGAKFRPDHYPPGYDAALVSPPYGETSLNPGLTHGLHFGRDPEDVDKKRAREGQTPEGYDATIMSPPYGEALPEKGTNIGSGWGRCRSMVQMSEGYTPADAVITSPAYGDVRQDGGAHQFGENSAMSNYTGEARVKSRAQRDRTNIGNLKYGSMVKALALVARLKAGEEIPESEWAAMEYLECMALIYWHCLAILRKGGLCILVLKDYRRDKARVDLIGDTTVLMKAVGFVFHDKALALTSKIEDGRVISKVSPFVRVNARKPEKNGGPVLLPAGEEVLVFRKE